MKKIDFKAWDTKRKMFTNFMIVDNMFKFMDKVTGAWIRDDEQKRFKLLQYTGLKDKNGVKIFEGDVLFHPLQGRRKVFYPYSETVASYGLRDIDNEFGSTLQDSHAVWEVIGNIHDNPELIGKKK